MKLSEKRILVNLSSSKLITENTRVARSLWPAICKSELLVLKKLTTSLELDLRFGDLIRLNNLWYVTHSGLLRLATRRRCSGIHTQPILKSCDPARSCWVFNATVFKSPKCKGFTGYGDADPSNVSPLVHGAEMRIAETRAVNRALRKAYGIGICSVEEIGSVSGPVQLSQGSKKLPSQPSNGHGSSRTVRDRLCQVIRQHQLDPNLVNS